MEYMVIENSYSRFQLVVVEAQFLVMSCMYSIFGYKMNDCGAELVRSYLDFNMPKSILILLHE